MNEDREVMKGIRVRAYRHADLVACLAVFETNVPGFFREHEREEYMRFLEALPGPYLVLENDQGEIVAAGGYAVVEEEERADLCWGMVRADLQGRGLGRVLTERRISEAVADPMVKSLAINTSQHTRGFYERFGFRLLEVVPDGYAPGLDRCEMRWDRAGTAVVERPGGHGA